MGYSATVHLDWGVFFEPEAPTTPVRALLPAELILVEPAPSRVLLLLDLVHFLSGKDQLNLSECHESIAETNWS